jgi:hypothetical protein
VSGVLAIAIAIATFLTPATRVATRQVKPVPVSESPGNCDPIIAELARQGASDYVANRLGGFIAKRESNCYPRQVHDADDWSFSRFGLNGITAGLRDYWRSACDADVRWDTRILSVDVRCALAAYRDLGWQPWAVG